MDTNKFINRHAGITEGEIPSMLQTIGVQTLEQLIDQTIPANIRLKDSLNLPDAMTERELAEHIAELASKNQVFTSYIGMGWYDTICPAPIQRNVLENPVWYTSYTPYQAEVSQGRLEALLNFQTVICELTGLPLTNCSLLDEATAAAEAATMFYGTRSRAQIKAEANTLFVDNLVFESTLAVIHTRMLPQGIKVVTGDYKTFQFTEDVFGAIVQYPNANGSIEDYTAFVKRANENGTRIAVAADLMSLVILTPPGEWGADVVFGSAQRFGTPMFYGGPSAGYMATKDDYKRAIPGRIIGISKDAYGRPAYRLALQTREQHIKREKATSNICTAQALLATMSGFYAVYHGADGLRDIANRIHSAAGFLAGELEKLGYKQLNKNFFDTLMIELPSNVSINALREIALECKVNLRYFDGGQIGISIDETTQPTDIGVLLYIFAGAAGKDYMLNDSVPAKTYFDKQFARTSDFLQQDVFKKYRTETELMRYITRLGRKDISLAHSMISLGSCTMKLNAASELFALSRPEFQNIHPYAPEEQVEGYKELIENLSAYLAEITGFKGVSLQPNSGASGEYAGLRVIRTYLESKGEGHRNIVLLPASAHGTNPASAVQCGYDTVTVKTDENGNIDLQDFREKAEANKDNLAATMITYPSTHGIFELDIKEMCDIVHACGGQVYMDGANMNAQVGLTNPGFIGADVCHLNLHKTFASPHGGGGPGVGPICVVEHLVPFLPSHPEIWGSEQNAVSAAPYGSAGILPITYAYIRLLGAEGLTRSTEIAILNANYLAAKLKDTYGVVYTGATGRVGHELILECRTIKERSGIDEGDIAKRLMDFGYHAPTLSFPVHGTLMIEPTESESKEELDRFLEVLDCIWKEIKEVEEGTVSKEDNVLKNAPHPEYEVVADEWKHEYSRSKAAFPLDWLRENKFWINVARVDNAYGDRNLIPTLCGCQV
ncbi:glycine dehydrogenase [Parabacteroides sp. PF5-5]|uniref:aminomethyl-transferring glycine dehydrogenase n=1 Tax=unclassified Parabacteroides TaxID=2649774 RepID=UPI0024745087|nr:MULTISPECIES: aminomethyl-transferring glycine dehydrogenase [unclassified Parabacteroides]MDH6304383.1 glycine dehydrogenase [Parabacteroides sp. PH5-39]MDH6315464.1 glycine dehydrogenase [Parabacteroides sp. PF5-13]MDH6319042.1 glycine dehydrogenase [Parabacteroides sp. PH5-13]MDH6322772.1 glycine dehydrogenase [Parabacteroides sp. PH5-8]MDH6326656.1 glycine dehydrogenase [Parabacteroides sp. PH5-41]